MHVDNNGYDAATSENMYFYLPCVIKENNKRRFSYMAGNLW